MKEKMVKSFLYGPGYGILRTIYPNMMDMIRFKKRREAREVMQAGDYEKALELYYYIVAEELSHGRDTVFHKWLPELHQPMVEVVTEIVLRVKDKSILNGHAYCLRAIAFLN